MPCHAAPHRTVLCHAVSCHATLRCAVQAITKGRWLHHTSFLWDFQDERMRLLKHPGKAPEYRAVSRARAGQAWRRQGRLQQGDRSKPWPALMGR